MRRRKVLVLASTFPRWKNDSTPPFVYELEKRLGEKFEIHVLAPHYDGARKDEVMDGLNIHRFQYWWPAKHQKLGYGGGILPNLKKNPFLIIQMFSLVIFELIHSLIIVKRERINLIHVHWVIPYGLIALIINKLFGIPYIVTSHGSDVYGLKAKIFVWLKKIFYENSQKIIVVSNHLKKEIISHITTSSNIDVISMGVDSQQFNPNKYSDEIKTKYKITGPFLLFVGRLVEVKGIQYLISAMPSIIKKYPKAKLLIIGDGPLRKPLEQMVENLDIKDNVVIPGPIKNSELPSYYATADIFIGPSIITKEGQTEGFGLTFVEAMFSECIPIGTDVGGISDIIEDGQNGILIKDRDSRVIAESIIKVLRNKDLKEKLKRNSRRFTINKFEWNIVASKYDHMYRLAT